MKRAYYFYKDAKTLGLSNKVFFISIILYLASVLFEAIGIYILLPIIYIFLTGKGLGDLIGSQELINKIIDIINNIGLEANEYTIAYILLLAIVMRQAIVFSRSCWNAFVISNLIYTLRKKSF